MSYFSFWRRFSYNPSQTYALGAQKPPTAHVIEPVKFWILNYEYIFVNNFRIPRVKTYFIADFTLRSEASTDLVFFVI